MSGLSTGDPLTSLPSAAGPDDRLELGQRRMGFGRPTGLVLLLVGFAFVLWLPTRSEPRLMLGAGLAVAMAIDALLAHRALLTPTLDIEPPPQAVVGRPVPSLVQASAGHYPLCIETLWLWPTLTIAVDDDAPGIVDLPASARGVVRAALVDLSVTGPLGMFVCRRRARVWFRVPMDVAPAPREYDVAYPALRSHWFGLTETAPTGHELFRGVRPYVRGDARRRLHWKATAHHGSLMVRE